MSTRWSRVSGQHAGEQYQARLEAAAASGKPMHGEADLVQALLPPPARVLDAGCGTGRVAVELTRRGYDVVGVDCDAAMLDTARRLAPDGHWLQRDLAALVPDDVALGGAFDLVLAAGNVVPLLAPGTEAGVVARLAATLRPGGLLVAGFGLDPAHLPLDDAPVTLEQYDAWCAAAGLRLRDRWATWERDPFQAGGGYAVSVSVLTGTSGPGEMTPTDDVR